MPEKLTVPIEAFFNRIHTSQNCYIQGERCGWKNFYIKRCAEEKYSREALVKAIARDDYHHRGQMPNNFVQILPTSQQALLTINTFKDEYLLDT